MSFQKKIVTYFRAIDNLWKQTNKAAEGMWTINFSAKVATFKIIKKQYSLACAPFWLSVTLKKQQCTVVFWGRGITAASGEHNSRLLISFFCLQSQLLENNSPLLFSDPLSRGVKLGEFCRKTFRYWNFNWNVLARCFRIAQVIKIAEIP